MHMRQTVTGVVTGKPLNIGGSRGRREATGRGCMVVCDEALKHLDLPREGSRVVIQGFGNVGGMAAKLMAAQGFKIIGIIEYDGAVYNPNGLDIDMLSDYRRRNGSIIIGFKGGETSIAGSSSFPTATSCCPPRRRTSSPRAMRIASRPASSAKAPTAPPLRSPTRSLPTRKSSSSPTFWPTPAASPSPTSNGCRIARATSGTKLCQRAAGRDHGRQLRRRRSIR